VRSFAATGPFLERIGRERGLLARLAGSVSGTGGSKSRPAHLRGDRGTPVMGYVGREDPPAAVGPTGKMGTDADADAGNRSYRFLRAPVSPLAAAALCLAQRAFCASLMRFRPSALILRRRFRRPLAGLVPLVSLPVSASLAPAPDRVGGRPRVPRRNSGKARKIAACSS
jgi:hypothetical protein